MSMIIIVFIGLFVVKCWAASVYYKNVNDNDPILHNNPVVITIAQVESTIDAFTNQKDHPQGLMFVVCLLLNRISTLFRLFVTRIVEIKHETS